MGLRGPKKGSPFAGRPRGAKNKIPALLKEAILQAAELAGGVNGLVGYLNEQAHANPGPFLALLGKVLPLQIAGDPDNPLTTVQRIERVVTNDPAEWQNTADHNTARVRSTH